MNQPTDPDAKWLGALMNDILQRLRDSSQNESSHELQCRCIDAADEIERLREFLYTIAYTGMTADQAEEHARDALGKGRE